MCPQLKWEIRDFQKQRLTQRNKRKTNENQMEKKDRCQPKNTQKTKNQMKHFLLIFYLKK